MLCFSMVDFSEGLAHRPNPLPFVPRLSPDQGVVSRESGTRLEVPLCPVAVEMRLNTQMLVDGL